MIISVASGKGGTGKTTVAVNLAQTIGTGVQLLDCDVEEPNAHLFIRPQFKRTEIITAPVPVVDEKKCDLCGQCSEICQFKAIITVGETVLSFPELCHSCGGCAAVCPTGAISETGRELGIIRQGYRNGLELIHGELRVGEAMSPPLIKNVRTFAHPEKLTIIDAPPGTSCPVIASIRDTDVVVLVTEPTPFGLNDLKLAVGAVKLLNIPCGLVINRFNIGDNSVEAYAKEEDLPILLKIPFDRQVAEAYSNGEMIVESIVVYKKKFRKLYRNIMNLIV